MCDIVMSINGNVLRYIGLASGRKHWRECGKGDLETQSANGFIKWVHLENANGPEILQHKCNNKVWPPERRLTLVMQSYQENRGGLP